MNRFIQKLPAMHLVTDRSAFLAELAKDKVALHLGCADQGDTPRALEQGYLLHSHLAKSAKMLYGVDVDTNGLQLLRDHGFKDLHELSVYDLHQAQWPGLEVVIAGEILEHLSSFEKFFHSLAQVLSRHHATCILTVPNAFSMRNLVSLAWSNTELVNSDHNCYFSPPTLQRVVERHGLQVKRLLCYSDVARASGFKKAVKKALNALILQKRPCFAEGLIVEVASG